MLDLAGVWTLSDESGAHVLPFDLPGDGITALHRAGVIPDPYVGRNEYDCRWISERDWVARRSFSHAGGAVDLVIDGLDTVAEVRLNGAVVLAAANAFRRWRVDVTAALRAGENQIEISFRSPVRAAADRQAGMPFYIPYQQVNGPIPFANMLRKPQCDFGWDWNVALGQFGVWGTVMLEPQGPRIGDIVVTQVHRDGAVEVSLAVHAEGVAEVTATLCGVTEVAPVRAGVARAGADGCGPCAVVAYGAWRAEPASADGDRWRRCDHPADRLARPAAGVSAGCGGAVVRGGGQRRAGLCAGRELDPGGCLARADHPRWRARAAAIGGRCPHEHDPGLGRRAL